MWKEAEIQVSVSSVLLLLNLFLTSSLQADHLETMMRDQLKVQELMDTCLNSMSEELRQLHSQSQEDGAKMAVMSLQLQEVMSSVEMRSEVVGRDLEEVNGCFDCHRGEINHLKRKEVELKEKEEELRGYVLGAAHESEVFIHQLNQMEERLCKCGQTPSEVGEELSSEEDTRMKLSYASARGSKYIAPPVENPIPIPVPAPCLPCGLTRTCPALEEIVEEPRDTICDDLDALLREANVERARDLQEESSQSVVCSPPRLGSEGWRGLNKIHWMCPGPGRREQRATRSRPYIRRASSRHPSELWGSAEPRR